MTHKVRGIDIFLFDIGGTLGLAGANGLTPFPGSAELLRDLRDIVGLRVGIITTLGTQLTNADAMAMLQQAGLAPFIDPQGFVSDHDTGGIAKPRRAIYEFAARQAGLPTDRCLFIGENLAEVVGALAAGMHALLKPSTH
jgi:FMN phosphatase YigB (HAD superfamily)